MTTGHDRVPVSWSRLLGMARSRDPLHRYTAIMAATGHVEAELRVLGHPFEEPNGKPRGLTRVAREICRAFEHPQHGVIEAIRLRNRASHGMSDTPPERCVQAVEHLRGLLVTVSRSVELRDEALGAEGPLLVEAINRAITFFFKHGPDAPEIRMLRATVEAATERLRIQGEKLDMQQEFFDHLLRRRS